MVFVAVWCLAGSLIAGQNAAPSSHLVFDDNFEGDILINEVRVPKSGMAMYTYYETLVGEVELRGMRVFRCTRAGIILFFQFGIIRTTPHRLRQFIVGLEQ